MAKKLESSEKTSDKVVKECFLKDIAIDNKELAKENKKYFEESNESKLIKMMSIKVARIEKLLIYFMTATFIIMTVAITVFLLLRIF